MLSKEETQHIAKLARLGLSDSEIEKYQRIFRRFWVISKNFRKRISKE